MTMSEERRVVLRHSVCNCLVCHIIHEIHTMRACTMHVFPCVWFISICFICCCTYCVIASNETVPPSTLSMPLVVLGEAAAYVAMLVF